MQPECAPVNSFYKGGRAEFQMCQNSSFLKTSFFEPESKLFDFRKMKEEKILGGLALKWAPEASFSRIYGVPTFCNLGAPILIPSIREAGRNFKCAKTHLF